MRIAYCSDLHLEVKERDFDLPDADVLLLAGDVCMTYDLRDAYEFSYISARQRQFLIDVSKKYSTVYWVAGNHEYWDNSTHGTFRDVKNFLNEACITNIHFTSCDKFDCGIRVLTATLWTDINGGDYLPVMNGYYMRDYEKITLSSEIENVLSRPLWIKDTLQYHQEHKKFLQESLYSKAPTIVMTHHVPVLTSDKIDSHRAESLKYFYYCTDMEHLILDHPHILYWIHGHDHSHGYNDIGTTKMVSNCRGYGGYEEISKTFKIEVLEV